MEYEILNNPKFQEDFIGGCITFLSLANMNDPDAKDSYDIFKEILNPIQGNRNPKNTMFTEHMPMIYEKIIKYCAEKIDMEKKDE